MIFVFKYFVLILIFVFIIILIYILIIIMCSNFVQECLVLVLYRCLQPIGPLVQVTLICSYK
jgi:hypothetical protein